MRFGDEMPIKTNVFIIAADTILIKQLTGALESRKMGFARRRGRALASRRGDVFLDNLFGEH